VHSFKSVRRFDQKIAKNLGKNLINPKWCIAAPTSISPMWGFKTGIGTKMVPMVRNGSFQPLTIF
jgi:hypothetical protein